MLERFRKFPFHRFVPWIKSLATLAVIGFIAWRIQRIGLEDVLRSMPRSYAVYALLPLSYMMVPLGDFFAYRRVWGPAPPLLSAMIRKQILNAAVVDYAGEAHFALLARRGEGDWKARLAHIKDVNILSAQASNFLTVAVILLFLQTAVYRRVAEQFPSLDVYMLAAAAAVAGIVLGVFLLRGRLFRLDGDDQMAVFGIHMIRCTAQMGLSVAIWHFAIPSVQLTDWFLFLTATMAVNRLPFLPNKDVVTAAIGVILGGQTGAAAHAVAALFVVLGAFQFLMHGILYLGLHLSGLGREPRPAVEAL